MSAADMHYICNGLGRIFAWLTHQRVYEITSKQAEAILQMRLTETLGLDVLRALPEAGLHIIIPNVPHLNNPELLPSAIFASLDTFENPNNLWLILKVDMRDMTKEFMLQIFDSTANRFLTIEESMKKVDEANRYTLYPCFQILVTLISPNLKLQAHKTNVVLLPSNRDVHPAIDKSFVWPKQITRCAVGWVGVSNYPSYEELHKKLWHQKHK